MFIEPLEQNEFELRQERDIALLTELIIFIGLCSYTYFVPNGTSKPPLPQVVLT
jgi:hypothetical protein